MHLFVQQFNRYNDVLFYDIFIIYLSFLIFLLQKCTKDTFVNKCLSGSPVKPYKQSFWIEVMIFLRFLFFNMW